MARTAAPDARPLESIPADELVGTMTRVRPDQLHRFHKNARRGDVDAIAGSLRKHSQYRPIVVNVGTYTGRPFEVLAGNHTLAGIQQNAMNHPEDPRWNGIDVFWVDEDEAMCTSIVIADNRTAELGTMDFGQLKELLDSLPTLEGTGFTDVDYQALAQSMTPPSLDDLAAEFGDGVTNEDLLERVSLKLEPDTNKAWLAHRKNYESDDAAMQALLA